jgi:hypothetical protein
MKSKKPFSVEKAIVSPFVGIAFLAVSVTGISLFFHVKNHSIVAVHEWLGWAFVVGGLVHLLIHYRQMLSYMKSMKGILSAAIAVVLLIILSVAGMSDKDGHHHKSERSQYHGE